MVKQKPRVRKLVYVEPRLKGYEPYAYWLLQAAVTGFDHRAVGVCPIDAQLATAWSNMMRRCYGPSNGEYPRYGAKGVSVCKRWHSVQNYVREVKTLHGWRDKLDNWGGYALDKDYYSSNQYGADTCIWISVRDNATYTLQARPIKVAHLWQETLYLSVSEAARHIGMRQEVINNWLAGKRRQTVCLEYDFEYAEPSAPLRYGL